MTKNTANRRLTEGNVMRHIVRMTIPMVIGLVATISMSVADTWFVAQLGKEYLSAISFTFPIAMFVLSIGIGLAAGTGALVAQALGADDLARTRRMTLSAIILSFLIIASFTLLGLATIDPLFTALGASDLELPIIHDYMVFWYPSMIVLIIPMTINTILRSAGNAKWPGISMFTAAIVNAILDPILIFGLFDLPALGVKGAAISSIIGSSFSTVISLYILVKHEKLLTTESHPSFASFKKHAKGILAIGIPASISQMIGPLSSSFVTAILARINTDSVSAFGIATRIEGLAMVVIFAMTAIINSMAAQNYGAGKMDRVQEILKSGYLICLITGLFSAIILFLFARPIAMFFTDAPNVIELTIDYFQIVPISYLAYGMIITIGALFNGIGKPKIGLYLSFMQRILFLMLAIGILAFLLGFGTQGVFAAITISSALVAGYAYFKGQHLVDKHTV